jgi:tRNA(fMet)-specific endonuclease VapC
MNYLLDTDTTSYLIKKNSPYHQQVIERLTALSPDAVAISTITVSELASGLQQIPHHNLTYKKQLKDAFAHFITSINVIDFTYPAALLYGDIRAQLKADGNDIGAMDCLIAAHALSEKRILVTNNKRHFSRIKHLEIENWTH